LAVLAGDAPAEMSFKAVAGQNQDTFGGAKRTSFSAESAYFSEFNLLEFPLSWRRKCYQVQRTAQPQKYPARRSLKRYDIKFHGHGQR
jgi:hypothetical protein